MIGCSTLFYALTHEGKKEMFSIAVKWAERFSNPPDTYLTEQEKELIISGKKIAAIKSIRDRTAEFSLREAMDIVEHYKEFHRINLDERVQGILEAVAEEVEEEF